MVKKKDEDRRSTIETLLNGFFRGEEPVEPSSEFRPGLFKKIEAFENQRRGWHWPMAWLLRPAVAVAAVALVIYLGLGQSERWTTRHDAELVAQLDFMGTYALGDDLEVIANLDRLTDNGGEAP